MTPKMLELLKTEEDEIVTQIENWTTLRQLILYRTLYGLGFRMGTVNQEIERELRKEAAKE